jgi:hypothetical protein
MSEGSWAKAVPCSRCVNYKQMMSNMIVDIHRSELLYLQVRREPKSVQLGRENLRTVFFNPGIRSGLSSHLLVHGTG